MTVLKLLFDTIIGARYAVEAKPSLDATWALLGSTSIGTGQRMSVQVPINTAAKFLQLVAGP